MNQCSRLKFCDVGVRLQAPSLIVGSCYTTADVIERENSIFWKAMAGSLLMDANCVPQGGNLWYLEYSLSNDGPDVEVRISLPYLFYQFNQDTPVRVFSPLFGGVLEVAQQPIKLSYPGPASFCMTAASGLKSTLATGLLNDDQRHVVIRHIPAGTDGQIRFVFEKVLIKKGETVKLPRQFICIGNDWAEAMLPYKQWFNSTFQRLRNRPGWWATENWSETRKAHCVAPYNPPEAAAGVWIFDNEGKPRTFEQLKREVDDALADGEEKGYRPLFYQFGWWQGMADIKGLFMFDSVCGDYVEAHNTAKEIIEYIHSKGLRTYLYTNAISAGDESVVFREHPELFVRDVNGLPVYNEGYPMYMFCPGAPGMRNYWEKVLRYSLIELDADGLFLDQVCGGTPPQYCYEKAHGHAHPDTYGMDILSLVDFIAEMARSLKPDCYIGGELVQDCRALLLDEAHGYGYTGPRSALLTEGESFKETQPAEYYVFTKYLCPEIFTAVSHSPEAVMNGAAGHMAWKLWRENRPIFEHGCLPCKVEPAGALAYLFGPLNGKSVLAVRARGEMDTILIKWPSSLPNPISLPDGLEQSSDGVLMCRGSEDPSFYVLELFDK